MVELDWKTILSFNYQDIKDIDRDRVYESISWMDPGDIEISFGDMKALFIVAQDMLRYKGEQVQSLTSELDEMAIKQGEIEAEIKLKKSEKDSTHSKDLTEILLQQENKIEANKGILEKLFEEISALEDQRAALVKERDNDSDSTPDPISELDRMKEIGDSLKKKNQHIKELLFDIQAIAEENKQLRDKLTHLKEKLAEATHHIHDLTLLVTNTKGESKHLKEKIQDLSQANLALQNHLQNLTEINHNQDAQLDEFAQQVELRINEWKELLKAKQAEIEDLQSKSNEFREKPESSGPIEPNFFTQMIKQREDQIQDLQGKLSEAAEEMLYSAETIERLKEEKASYETTIDNLRMGISHDSIEGSNTIAKLRIEMQKLKIEKDDLEECLKIKELELAEALKQLNLFEDGEFGLKESIHSNKKMKQNLKIRDEHINKLVADLNKHIHLLDQVQLENSVMRKKLNLPSEQPISLESVLSQHAKRKKELNASVKKLALLEEQNISLQIQLRQKEKCIKKLYGYVKSKGVKLPEHFLAAILAEENISRQAFEREVAVTQDGSGDAMNESNDEPKTSPNIPKSQPDNEEITLIRENYQHLIDENEGLRKGLHEILDAIKEKATTSSCDITSTCLEKLLRALDARHVAGWYHPAMRMLMELQAEKGTQDGLRSMLKEARTEILSTLDLLAKESQKTLQLEQKLTEIEQSKDMITGESDKNVDSEENQGKDIDLWTLNRDSVTDTDFKDGKAIADTYIKRADKNYSIALHENLIHFHKQFEYLYDSMIEIFTQSNSDKNKWSATEEEYKNNIEALSVEIDSVKLQLNEIKQSNELDENLLKSSGLGDKICLERKNKHLLETFRHIRDIYEMVKAELFQKKIETFEKLRCYEIEKQKLMFHVADLRNSLRKSVPLGVFLKQNEKMNSYEMKYRSILNNEVLKCDNDSIDRDRDEINLLTGKYELLQAENDELKNIIRTEKEFRITSQNIEAADDNLKHLATKLSTSETEVIALQQKLKYLQEVNSQLSHHQDTLHLKLENYKSLLSTADVKINSLESENLKLQEQEMALFNKFQASSADEVKDDSNTLENTVRENRQLKIAIVQLQNKMEALEEQISDIQHDKLVNGLEINILRHQVLDLQSANDNKAIIARLSGEILVSHLHTAEIHKTRDKLTKSLQKEKERRKHLQSIIEEKESQFDNYVTRTNFKISFLSSALQAMREQYQGSIPLAILDNIYNAREEIKCRIAAVNKLENEMPLSKDLPSMKIDLKSAHCLNGDLLQCPHNVELELKECKWEREKSELELKIKGLEENRLKMETQLNSLEESLLMISFTFGKTNASDEIDCLPFHMKRSTSVVELIDIDVEESQQTEDQEIYKPTPKPRTMKKPTPRSNDKINDSIEADVNLPGSPMKNIDDDKTPKPSTKTTVVIQTDSESLPVMTNVECQTDIIEEIKEKNCTKVFELTNKIDSLQSEIKEALSMVSERSERILDLENDNLAMKSKMAAVDQLILDKEAIISDLNAKIEELEKDSVNIHPVDEKVDNETELEHLKKLLKDLKEIENEKNAVIEQYKELLRNEKSEHHDTNVLAQKQIISMKVTIETLEREHNSLKDLLTAPSHVENYNATMEKYRGKILQLEDRCFQLQKDLDTNHASLISCKSECERWKNLANERFSNMESLSRRLDEKHSSEVVSYKTETSHWLAQLGDCRQEVGLLKAEITDQRTSAIRQITERDSTIHRLHTANTNLKHQILNLQSVISSSDPTFDLTAIVELDEDGNVNNSVMQTERGSANNVEMSSNISESNRNALISLRETDQSAWPQSLIDRIREEKQMLGKQNALLRRQIRVLTGRERRTRLELNNFRSQMSRGPLAIKSHHVDDTILLNRKIESLELQLSERSSVNFNNNNKSKQMALWDKQKRWQETSERWKLRYQEKCAQIDRLEKHLDAARVTVSRLEREKRQLDSRLSKSSREGQTPSTGTGNYDNHVEMLLQDKERLEEEVRSLRTKLDGNVKQSSLLEKLEWQQRRITSLELAERGKDVLVNEYERLLSQNSLLTKQNLKLESEILENQLLLVGKRLDPDGSDGENSCCKRVKQQRDHLESYSKLLKEENSYLIAKNIEYTALDPPVQTTGTVSQVKRISDLERTVLTLRGLIGRLQADNKRLQIGAGKSRKCPVQFSDNEMLENFKIENERLLRMMKDKDELLERAKSLLRKAADKEKHLVKEISMLKGQTPQSEN